VIVEYHRPAKLEEALDLLSRSHPLTLPLGGGTVLNTSDSTRSRDFAVVDLQSLGLDQILRSNELIQVGAMVRLQRLLDEPGLPKGLYHALVQETARNIREAATVAGRLVSANGRSALATALLGLDAKLVVYQKTNDAYVSNEIGLGDFLPLRNVVETPHVAPLSGVLITQVLLPVKPSLSYHSVSRTPADLPIVCAAVARWASGRTRVALGGYGELPLLVMDGPEPEGAEIAARNAFAQAGDQWASAAYRSEIAGILVKRCLEEG
jgi:CO/xanthine dehydrogenase FAD-binding subunit